jgi:hypothetical protein
MERNSDKLSRYEAVNTQRNSAKSEREIDVQWPNSAPKPALQHMLWPATFLSDTEELHIVDPGWEPPDKVEFDVASLGPPESFTFRTVRVHPVENSPDCTHFETTCGEWGLSGVVQRDQRGALLLRQLDIRPLSVMANVSAGEDVSSVVVVSASIQCVTPSEASINTSVLRSIKTDRLLARVEDAIATWGSKLREVADALNTDPDMSTWIRENPIALALAMGTSKASSVVERSPARRGRPGRGDEFYEQIARRYIDLHQEGHTRSAAQIIAHEQSEVDEVVYTVSAARGWIRKAREQGFLAQSPKQGSPAPSPGWRLVAIDAAHGTEHGTDL